MNKKLEMIAKSGSRMNPILKNIMEKRNVTNTFLSTIMFLRPILIHVQRQAFKFQLIATDVVKFGIIRNLKFGVYFDCDLDGITAGTIMVNFLKQYQINPIIIINEGKKHDVSSEKVPDDIDILIIVDSLLATDKFYEYTKIKNKDIDIVILDHHDIKQYPEDAILISSNREYPNPDLSGAGVVLKFCMLLEQLLDNSNKKIVFNYFDIAACGIIGDVSNMMSMENRAIAHYGFKNCKNLLLKHLTKDCDFDATFVIWKLAPLINSLCRANQNELAVKLFLSEDKDEVKSLLKKAEQYKTTQDEIIKEMIKVIKPTTSECMIIKTIPLEYKNYSGVIASKISDLYNKPTILMAFNRDNNMFQGSIRCSNFDLKSLVNKYLSEGEYCAGHKQAAGIGIKLENYNIVKNSLLNENVVTDEVISSDATIKISDLTFDFVEEVNFINRITGRGFEILKFQINNIMIDDIICLKEKHVKFQYNGIDFIIWNDLTLLLQHQSNKNLYINVIGTLNINKFAGKKRIQFMVSKVIYTGALNFRL